MVETSREHKKKASSLGPIRIAIVTISDTRTAETDVNGRFLKDSIAASGNVLAHYEILPDVPDQIEQVLEQLAASPAQVILFNGGTGISRRDGTYEALSSKLDKTITGFGEIFRYLSYEQVGSPAMLSRAIAGIYRGTVVFSTPGSPKAVQLAWNKLIKDELAHLVWEAHR